MGLNLVLGFKLSFWGCCFWDRIYVIPLHDQKLLIRRGDVDGQREMVEILRLIRF